MRVSAGAGEAGDKTALHKRPRASSSPSRRPAHRRPKKPPLLHLEIGARPPRSAGARCRICRRGRCKGVTQGHASRERCRMARRGRSATRARERDGEEEERESAPSPLLEGRPHSRAPSQTRGSASAAADAGLEALCRARARDRRQARSISPECDGVEEQPAREGRAEGENAPERARGRLGSDRALRGEGRARRLLEQESHLCRVGCRGDVVFKGEWVAGEVGARGRSFCSVAGCPCSLLSSSSFAVPRPRHKDDKTKQRNHITRLHPHASTMTLPLKERG